MSALHANNLIVEFALLLDGLFTKHALALHDSLSQPVFAAEDLMIEFTEEPLGTIVSVLHAEGLIHDVPTMHNLIESAPICGSPPKMFASAHSMIVSALAACANL